MDETTTLPAGWTPKLGWVTPAARTPAQIDAHANAVAKMVKFALQPVADLPVGTKIMLSDFWNKPEVVADTGTNFDRSPFHQTTGSCVGAGGGNALFTLIAVQRLLADSPTKAIIPWWPFSYGRCRALEGDRGRGEGAMGSSFASQVHAEGVLPTTADGLPTFPNDDGLTLSSSTEMAWSDGNSSLVTKYIDVAKAYPLGSSAEMQSPADMQAAVVNGFPGSFACDRFIGNASVQGSGDNARVVGHWDSNGGHQQWFFGFENNAQLGPLYAIGNNWPRGTYPKDPGGLPLVTCWVTEANVKKAFGYNAEVYAFSHLNYFPAQAALLSYFM